MTTAEFLFDKTIKTLAVGAADQLSTNVFDAVTAKRLFGGNTLRPPHLQFGAKIIAGTGALSIRCRFVGADNAALTTNVEIIADSGVQTLQGDGATALAIGSQINDFLTLAGQRTPKEFYGVIWTQGTADQQCEVTAVITEAPQSNMTGRKAAVP